ncbi:MAG: hypothetical protein AABY92_09165, partial [Thermodesulfobacteriota bacterium]
MQNFMLDHEAPIRLGFFFGILLFMALWEVISPRRELTTAKGARWFANLGLVVIDTLAIRLLIPLQAAGMALYAANHGWGIFNSVILPQWLKITLGVLGLDLAAPKRRDGEEKRERMMKEWSHDVMCLRGVYTCLRSKHE